MDEGYIHDVELLEAGEDATVPFETAEEALDLIASSVEYPVVSPSVDAGSQGWDDWAIAQIQGELAGFIAFVGTIHHQRDRAFRPAQLLQQGSADWRIVRLAG